MLITYIGVTLLSQHEKFESRSTVVEAKQKASFRADIGQAVAYMATYGMVSDGINWQFL